MDSRRCRYFVPSLLTPGDTVSFLVPAKVGPGVGRPTPAARGRAETGSDTPGGEPLSPSPDASSLPPEPSGPMEEIGPFTVLDVGNRLSSEKVFSGAHLQQTHANIIGIRVGLTDNRLDDRMAKKLLERLMETNYASVGVVLHSHKDSGK